MQVDQCGARDCRGHPCHEFPRVRARVSDELIAGVSHIVKVDAGEPGRFEGGQPDTAAEVGVRQRRAGRADEDERCVLGEHFKVLAQIRGDQVGEGDGTASGP